VPQEKSAATQGIRIFPTTKKKTEGLKKRVIWETSGRGKNRRVTLIPEKVSWGRPGRENNGKGTFLEREEKFAGDMKFLEGQREHKDRGGTERNRLKTGKRNG